MRRNLLLSLVLAAFLGFNMNLHAQDRLSFSGLAFLDYYYNVTNADPTRDDVNGFTYRRLFLTADYRYNEALSGRVRLEATDANTTARGTYPVVKDLYLTYSGKSGHSITAGIQPTVAFGVSESVWGFRSLEKTIMDLAGVVGPRDFGLSVRGPILPNNSIRYAALIANNSGLLGETDKYKRLYGQLELYPADYLAFSVGADYQAGADHFQSLQFNAFGGVITNTYRVGIEGFFSDRFSGLDTDNHGLSVFASYKESEKLSFVARYDLISINEGAPGTIDDFAVVGVSYQPIPAIRLIPNLHVLEFNDRQHASVTPRVTLEIRI